MKTIPKEYHPSSYWAKGNKWDVRTFHSVVDTYPNNFICYVEVRNRETGKITKHRGKGRYIGNFAPIWIRFQGKDMQLTEILRLA